MIRYDPGHGSGRTGIEGDAVLSNLVRELFFPKDIIPDKYIGVSLLDDAAVIAACIALNDAVNTVKVLKRLDLSEEFEEYEI